MKNKKELRQGKKLHSAAAKFSPTCGATIQKIIKKLKIANSVNNAVHNSRLRTECNRRSRWIPKIPI